LLCILKWVESREIGKSQPRWFVLAGLLAGFAAATKPNGLLLLLLLFFALAWGLGRVKTGIGMTFVQLALFVFLAILPLAPWLAKNFVWTGNPFFPFFSAFFDGIRGGGEEAGVSPRSASLPNGISFTERAPGKSPPCRSGFSFPVGTTVPNISTECSIRC